MAEPNKFAGLLQQMGILSPTERDAQNYALQMQQYQQQLQGQQVAQQSASRYGLFGGPMEQAKAAQFGVPNQLKIPDIPQAPDTSQAEQVMAGTLGSPVAGGSYSSQLYSASQQFLRMGDTQRAQMAYAAALQAAQEEQEEGRKVAEERRKAAAAGNPGNPFTVGVAGNPHGRQEMRDIKDEYGRVIGQERVGPSYEIGKNETNVNLGGILTESQRGDEVRKFADQLKTASAFINNSKQYLGDISKGGVGGTAGNIVKVMSETFDTAKYALRAFKPDANYFDETDSRWEALSKNTGLAKATIIGMAYTLAASHSQDGRISDADFRYAMDELGGNTSSPEKAAAVMKRAIANLRKRIDDAYNYMPDDAAKKSVTGIYERFGKDFDAVFPKGSLDDAPVSSETDPNLAGWVEVAPGIFAPQKK